MRTIIIGDVHGFCGSLKNLLKQVGMEPDSDVLVFLGDLFDRGPDSRDVYLEARRLSEQFGNRLVLLRGNHEDYLLQERLTLKQRIIWEQVGRQATVRSFFRAGEKPQEAVPWLRKHARLYWETDGFQCVHAGVLVEPAEANDLQTLVHDHETVQRNRYGGKITVTGHIALEKATWFTGDGETTEELEDGTDYSLPETGIICIDTGCGKGGRLTAMAVEDGYFKLFSAAEQ